MMQTVETIARSSEAARAARERRKQRAMLVSISAATLLTLIKAIVAALTGSIAVLSEALHSGTDLVAASIVWYSLRRAASPPDRRHRYGHGKLEDASALVEGAIVVAAVAFIVYRAVSDLAVGSHVSSPGIAVAAMGFSTVVNLFVGLHLRRVARETESTGVAADSHQLLADVITSAAVALGLLLVEITGNDTIDPIVALCVSAIVAWIGASMIIDSTRLLLDESLPASEVRTIERLLRRDFAEVGFHRLRTRRAGSRRHVDLHLTMDGQISLQQAHTIANQIEDAIDTELGDTDVLTHIEPASEAPPPGYDAGPSDRL